MNILFICSAKSWGGNEKWVSMAMHGLKKKHNVFFLGKTPHLMDQFGAGINAYRAPFRSVIDWKTKTIISRIVAEKKIDVIVSTKKKEYFLGGIAARSAGVKHFIRLGIMRNMPVPVWSRMVYCTLNDGIIVNAHRIKSNLLKYKSFKDHPIKVIYNGMPLPRECNKREPDHNSFNIVSTGMLTRRKGFHILIEAISMLPDELKNKVQLHVLGKGREEESLQEMIAEKDLKKSVHLHGFSDPFSLIEKANLFCLISGNEGISNALLEAMSCAVPVLTTNAGGAAEFLLNEKNGYLVARDAHAVSEKLAELMTMPKQKLSNTGETGKRTVKSLFDMDKMTGELEKFLYNFT